MTNPSDTELRECPFCGNAPAWLGVMDGHLIVCKAKECLSRYPQSSEKEAITAWNTRATDHLLEMAAEALKFYADEETYDDGYERTAEKAKQTLLTLQQHGFGKD